MANHIKRDTYVGILAIRQRRKNHPALIHSSTNGADGAEFAHTGDQNKLDQFRLNN